MERVISFVEKPEFIPVDSWIPQPEDVIFKHTKGAIILPVSKFYGVENSSLDNFIVSAKRSYNSEKMRQHCTHYLNYFEKFYDTDKELISIYYRLKYLIDLEKAYDEKAFLFDIHRYILSPSIMHKITIMNRDNYNLKLKYIKDESLRYTDKHGFILMKISLIMNCLIPIVTHFIHVKKVPTNAFLLQLYDSILDQFDVDIYSKLYETSNSNIVKNKNYNPIWGKQDIRGINTTTLTIYSVNNIIMSIIPKYVYNENMVCFNFNSIVKTIKYQVTDIGYEFDYIPLSSSKRDLEQNSEFDKFESYLTKQDESLYIQNKVNCEETMKNIERWFGPFSREEIDFYAKNLSENNQIIINGFQRDLIFNLFYKYFGDVVSIKAINRDDYIKLMIAARKILQSNSMVILPYILSSKITRLVPRKILNKKELTKLEASQYYPAIYNKYKNDKIMTNNLISTIATILSSEFKIIDFGDEEFNGKVINSFPADIILEEMLMYADLI